MSRAVTTHLFDNLGSGRNPNETVLTSIAVQQRGIKHLFSCMVPGDQRGTEGFPLIVPGVTLEDGEVRDLLLTCSMGNMIVAYDANNPDPDNTGIGKVLWSQYVGLPVKNDKAYDYYDIADNWGILSTAVIDTDTMTLYALSSASTDGTFATLQYWFHAVSLYDGSPRATPFVLDTATYQPPDGLPPIVLDATQRKQRSALRLWSDGTHKAVLFCASTFSMNSLIAHGWVIAMDVTSVSDVANASTMSFACGWTDTARNPGGGNWMDACGLLIRPDNTLMLSTGNGSFDGITDLGESGVRLRYTPATATGAASLVSIDHYAPFTDVLRSGGPYNGSSLSLLPNLVLPTGFQFQTSTTDQDVGCGPPCYLDMSFTGFSKNVVILNGKDGLWWILDADNMGRTTLADFAPGAPILAHWAQLLSPPVGATHFPGDVNYTPDDPAVIATWPTTPYGFTQHGYAIVPYKSARFGVMLFIGGDNNPVQVLRMNPDFSVTFLGKSRENCNSLCTTPPGGGLGTNLALSCNGDVEDTAVLWGSMPYLDANKQISPDRILAWGADWIDPEGYLVTLWDSANYQELLPQGQLTHNKMGKPCPANGKLYLPTYSATIEVYGLGD